MSRSAQPRVSLPIVSRREAGISLEKTTEVGRVLESQLIADLICGAGTEKQQSLRFLHKSFLDKALRRKISDSSADIVKPRLRDSNTLSVPRKRPVLSIVSFDQLIETMEDLEILSPRGGRFYGIGAQPQEADHDQPCKVLQRSAAPCPLLRNFVAEFFKQKLNSSGLTLVHRREVGQGNTCRRYLEPRRHQAPVRFDQLPNQLLTHRQHMSVAVSFGDEGMRNRRWRQEEHRPGFDVLLIIKVHPDSPRLDVMDLEEPIVSVYGHVPSEKACQVAQSVVVNLAIAVALVVHLTDVDVRDWLPITHQFLPVVFIVSASYLPMLHPPGKQRYDMSA